MEGRTPHGPSSPSGCQVPSEEKGVWIHRGKTGSLGELSCSQGLWFGFAGGGGMMMMRCLLVEINSGGHSLSFHYLSIEEIFLVTEGGGETWSWGSGLLKASSTPEPSSRWALVGALGFPMV